MSASALPLVLVPGLMCDAAAWAAQRDALAAERPVHIHEHGPRAAAITAMAHDLLAAAPARFALAGHSMGGRVALEAARLAPQRIERLALLDTGLDPLPEGEAGAAERAKRAGLMRLAREQGMRAMGREWARGMVHPARLDTPLYEAVVDMVARHSSETFAAQVEALLGRPDGHLAYQALEVPVLLVCGRQDAWSPLARHERMQALRPASRLVVIEDAGHMTTMEQPAAVTAALRGWLLH